MSWIRLRKINQSFNDHYRYIYVILLNWRVFVCGCQSPMIKAVCV